MTSFLLSVIFLLGADQVTTDQTAQQAATPAAAAPTAAAPAAEPKMICKYEHVTGSRLSKQKVCRPEGQSSADQDTALQRELSRNGDYREAPSGFGN